MIASNSIEVVDEICNLSLIRSVPSSVSNMDLSDQQMGMLKQCGSQ